MPVVTLTVALVLSNQQKQQFAEIVHSTMVAELSVPAQDKMIRIIELSSDNFILSGSSQTILLEITLFPGRTRESKRAFYRSIVDKFTTLGIPAADIRILLHEVEPENWGLRGGIPGCDL